MTVGAVALIIADTVSTGVEVQWTGMWIDVGSGGTVV